MREVSVDRVGNALRRLAEDLVTERTRVALLQRENRELRRRLEALERVAEDGTARRQPTRSDATG